jgi:polynucleotide 5'-hydroxyl-kinase GRC3/NOL9
MSTNDDEIDTQIKIQSLSEENMTFRLLSPENFRSHIFISKKWKDTITSILEGIPEVVGQNSKGQDTKVEAGENSPTKRILICGAKGVGKSTMLRYLANRILSHGERNGSNAVAILDIDVGQPEFSPPGMLSLTIVKKPLLSPPHAHIICNTSQNNEDPFHVAEKHIDAYYFGFTSSKSNPVSYLKAVSCLVKTFEAVTEIVAEYGNKLPLLVNTDGWVKGMGFEILSSIIDVISPTDIVQICGHSNAKKFDLPPQAIEGRSIHVIDTSGRHLYTPPPSRSTSPLPTTRDCCNQEANNSISPSNLRSLRLVTYFLGGNGAVTKEGIRFDRSGIVDEDNVIASKLSKMHPYAISFNSLYYQMSNKGVAEKGSADNFKRISGLLNGCIVGLCAKNNHSDNPPSCIGLGIVRGVHKSRKLLFVLTPLSKERLDNVNILVCGKIKTPLEMLFRSARSESFSFQSCDGIFYAGIGSGKMKKTGRMQK